MKAIVCGRNIGTCSGVDVPNDFCLVIYNFKPGKRIDFPAGDLNVDYNDGIIEAVGDKNKVIKSADLIDIIKDAPREQTD